MHNSNQLPNDPLLNMNDILENLTFIFMRLRPQCFALDGNLNFNASNIN